MDSPLSIALISAHHSYRLNDFTPLVQDPSLKLYPVHAPEDFQNPDLIILPGTEDVAADFDDLEARGITPLIHKHAAAQKWVVGLCGGMHMMGRYLLDPHHRKYDFSQKKMLGLLDLDTVYGLPPTQARLRYVQGPWGCSLRGYETHRGQVSGEEPVLFRRADGSGIGYGHGRCWATYLHLCFHNAEFRGRFLQAVRQNGHISP